MSKETKKANRAKKAEAKAQADAKAKRDKLVQRLAIVGVAIIATAGAAWLAIQPAVGEGITVRAMRTPT